MSIPKLELHFDSAVRELYEVQELAESTNSPKEVKDGIAAVLSLLHSRDRYVEDNSSPQSESLKQISEFTQTHDWQKVKDEGKSVSYLAPVMMTGQVEGMFLKFLVSMLQAKRVLEIGMYTGYSTLSMAEALPPDGTLITCDTEQYLYSINREAFDRSPHGKKIDIKIGPAKDTLHTLAKDGLKFDFIFIDADKKGYELYYDIIMEKGLLAPRGTIAADNAFGLGKAYVDENNVIRAFNQKVAKDDRVQTVFVPVRDGVLLIRRKDEVYGQS